MIIFGTRGVNSTLEQGDFNCPQCEAIRPYKHKKVTQFFTLYFIPLIPLGNKGEFVECQSCKGTFITRVLDYQKDSSSDAFLSEYEKAIKHTMVLMMLADGVIEQEEMIAVRDIINKFGHHDITLDELTDYVAEVESQPLDISTYLKGVAPKLNEHGKEIIIKCALSVAFSDGHLDKTELDMIHDMGKVMEMSPSHLRGILGDIKAGATEFSDN